MASSLLRICFWPKNVPDCWIIIIISCFSVLTLLNTKIYAIGLQCSKSLILGRWWSNRPPAGTESVLVEHRLFWRHVVLFRLWHFDISSRDETAQNALRTLLGEKWLGSPSTNRQWLRPHTRNARNTEDVLDGRHSPLAVAATQEARLHLRREQLEDVLQIDVFDRGADETFAKEREEAAEEAVEGAAQGRRREERGGTQWVIWWELLFVHIVGSFIMLMLCLFYLLCYSYHRLIYVGV